MSEPRPLSPPLPQPDSPGRWLFHGKFFDIAADSGQETVTIDGKFYRVEDSEYGRHVFEEEGDGFYTLLQFNGVWLKV